MRHEHDTAHCWLPSRPGACRMGQRAVGAGSCAGRYSGADNGAVGDPMTTRLRKLLETIPPMTPEERERRRLGALRLKERLGGSPFYAKAAERDGPGYWEKMYASSVK